MFCENCGNRIEQSQQFCKDCGAEQPITTNRVSPNPTVTPHVDESTEPIKAKRSFFNAYRLNNLDLNDAEKHIKNAWIAALISAGVTALIVMLGILDTSSWFDVALIILFAFGIYRKNRIAAVGMFIYFVISKLVQIGQAGETEGFNIGSVFAAIAFLHYFYLGMVGTLRYQQLVPKEKSRYGMVFGVILGSLATLFIVFLLVGLSPEETSPQDIVLQADYQEGYKAGYVDGRASEATLGDSYVEIATEERRGAYDIGYLKGFINGCHEGGFDCNEIEQTINEALGDTELPDDAGVQLIPNSI